MSKEIKTIQDVINEVQRIQSESPESNFIFRGENAQYDKVSSTLYRAYYKDMRNMFIQETGKKEHELTEKKLNEINQKSERKMVYMNFSNVQLHITERAKKHYAEAKADFNIATELQHYGGKTNLIDFTKNALIALFFACDGESKQDGRFFILKYKKEEVEKEITYQNIDTDLILESNSKNNRVIFQNSIFIMPKNGYTERFEHVIPIPNTAKEKILADLNNLCNINTDTIYNDIYGFIQNEENYKTMFIHLHRGIEKYNFGIRQQNKKQREQYLKEAIEEYDKAIRLSPNFAEAYNNRGVAKDELGQYTEAIKDYSKAIELKSDYAEAYNNRANVNSRLGKDIEAIKDYDKAIEIESNLAEPYFGRGNAKDRLVKDRLYTYQDVIKDYDKAIKLNSDYINAYNNRGVAKKALGDLVGAISDYDMVIKIDPNSAEAYFNRAKAKVELGQNKEAKKDLNEAIRLNPDLAKQFM